MKSIASLLKISLPLLLVQFVIADTSLTGLFAENKCAKVPNFLQLSVDDTKKCNALPCLSADGFNMDVSCPKDEKDGLIKANRLFGTTAYIRVDNYDEDCKNRYAETTFIKADGSCVPFGNDGSAKFKVDKMAGTIEATMYEGTTKCLGDKSETKKIVKKDLGTACIDGAKVFVSSLSGEDITKPGPKAVPRGNEKPSEDNSGEKNPVQGKVYYKGEKCDSKTVPDSIWLQPNDKCTLKTCAATIKGSGIGVKTECFFGLKNVADYSKDNFKEKDFVFVDFFKSGSKCTGEAIAQALVRADNTCVIGQEKSTSYKASVNLRDGSVTFTTYKDTQCKSKKDGVTVKTEDQTKKKCLNNYYKVASKEVALNSIKPPAKGIQSFAIYSKNDKCAVAPDSIVYTSAAAECMSMNCFPTARSASASYGCHDTEEAALVDVFKRYGKTPFARVEFFSQMGCASNSIADKTVIIVKADGKCTPSMDGKSSQLATLNRDGSIQYTSFGNGNCSNKVKSEVQLDRKVSKADQQSGKCLDFVWRVTASTNMTPPPAPKLRFLRM